MESGRPGKKAWEKIEEFLVERFLAKIDHPLVWWGTLGVATSLVLFAWRAGWAPFPDLACRGNSSR